MTDFARLERHNGHQVLAYIEEGTDADGDSGVFLKIRCDVGLSIKMNFGPWESDDAGWDFAQQQLASVDLAAFSKEAEKTSSRFLKADQP